MEEVNVHLADRRSEAIRIIPLPARPVVEAKSNGVGRALFVGRHERGEHAASEGLHRDGPVRKDGLAAGGVGMERAEHAPGDAVPKRRMRSEQLVGIVVIAQRQGG